MLAACNLPVTPTLIPIDEIPGGLIFIGTPGATPDPATVPDLNVDVQFMGTRPCGVIGAGEESAYIKITNNGAPILYDADVRIREVGQPPANWNNIMAGTNDGMPDRIYPALCEQPWGGQTLLSNGQVGYTRGNLFTPVDGQDYIIYYIVCGSYGYPYQCVQGQFELTYHDLGGLIFPIPERIACFIGPGPLYPTAFQIESGMQVEMLARDISSAWLFMRLVQNGRYCWAEAALLPLPRDLDINITLLPIFDWSVIFIGTPFPLVAVSTSTPSPSAGCVYTALVNLFCRIGPSYGQELDTFMAGESAQVIGQSPDGSHIYVIGPKNGHTCAVPNGPPWGELTGNCSTLPQFTPYPTSTSTPAPQQPTATWTPGTPSPNAPK
jgi:hypothetical protein